MVVYKKTELKNGIPVVAELHPSSRSACLGLFVENGTRDEPGPLMGISHFLEHLVFKGTRKRTAFDLAKSMEAVGGELNAYTSREYTCYHTQSLYDDVELAADVLVDIAQNATFPKQEFKREQSVVLQEIFQSRDNVEDCIFDDFLEEFYAGSPLGFNTLGTEETISKMSLAQVRRFYKKNYSTDRMVVALAGRFDWDNVIRVLNQTLGRIKRARPSSRRRRKPRPRRFLKWTQRDLEQVHLVVGFPTTSFTDKRRLEAFVVNALLGGGMTSKLYQRIREEKGLAYSIFSHLQTFTDVGLCQIYASTTPDHLREVVKVILEELEAVRKRGISTAELKLFRTQVRGSLLLGADELESRMTSLGVNEMVFGRYRPVEEIVAEVDAVSEVSVRRFLREEFDPRQASMLLVGPVSEGDRKWIEGKMKRPLRVEAHK